MSISAANATYSGNGPTQSGQIIAQSGLAGPFAQSVIGLATITGDGSTASAQINYIDGTKQLGFNPSGVLAMVVGGNDSNNVGIKKCVDSADVGGSKSFTATFTAAPSNSGTVTILFIVLK